MWHAKKKFGGRKKPKPDGLFSSGYVYRSGKSLMNTGIDKNTYDLRTPERCCYRKNNYRFHFSFVWNVKVARTRGQRLAFNLIAKVSILLTTYVSCLYRVGFVFFFFCTPIDLLLLFDTGKKIDHNIRSVQLI